MKKLSYAIICMFLICLSLTACEKRESIIGTWEMTNDSGDVKITFSNDNTILSKVISSYGEESQEEGTYRINGDQLTLKTEPSPEDPPEGRYEITATFEIIGNKLILAYENEVVAEFTKQ